MSRQRPAGEAPGSFPSGLWSAVGSTTRGCSSGGTDRQAGLAKRDSDDLCVGDDLSGDSDGDGLCDDSDPCDGASNSDVDGDGVCDEDDQCFGDDTSGDTDGDGICEDIDVCVGNDAEGDTDSDLFCDDIDACPLDVENDADSDGICEAVDNCDLVENSDQADVDEDGLGDACDLDNDNDGVDDIDDNCRFDANPGQEDFDGDGIGDVCDADSDGDGVIDSVDQCLGTPDGEIVDARGCTIAQLFPCENPWKNHGAYVSQVTRGAKTFRDSDLITGELEGQIVSGAGDSTCGICRRSDPSCDN